MGRREESGGGYYGEEIRGIGEEKRRTVRDSCEEFAFWHV